MKNFTKLREAGDREDGIPHLNEVSARPPSPTGAEYRGDDDSINLVEFWRVLAGYRRLIAAVSVAAVAFSLFTVWHMTPVYRAGVLLAPVLNESSGVPGVINGQLGELAALAGYNLREENHNLAEAIAALNSRSLSVAFLREENIVPVIFSEHWDAEKQDWREDYSAPTDWEVFNRFEKIRTIDVNRGSGLVTLTLEWNDPELAAQWANALVKRVNDRLRQEAILESEKSIDYLKEQLAATGVVEVQQAIYRLIEAQTKKKMLASTREEYAFKVIDPAMAPDRDAPVGPRPASIIVSGIVFGLMAGIFLALFVHVLRLHMKRANTA